MVDVNPTVTIENVGVLDLTVMKSKDLVNVSHIENVGLILVPEALLGQLMKISQENVGMTVSIPHTVGKIKILTGQLSLSGEVFSNYSGSAEDILVIAGQVIITSSIDKIGYKDVVVAGQLIAPKSIENVLATAVTRLSGQIAYYTSDTPRLFVGNDSFSRDFFDLIEGKMSIVLIGNFEIGTDVDIAAIKQKISELILIGGLSAPKPLVPLLQLLAVVKLGDIIGKDDIVAEGQP